tara:strand:+ start:3367 stop:3540 length:174 start_codon:yes stop_codon:yes gene_type:complete
MTYKEINTLTLKELRKEESDLSETLHFASERGERIDPRLDQELDRYRHRLNQLEGRY